MGKVVVQAADIQGSRIGRLKVALAGLPPRVIDRDAVIAWMRDGHSFVPAGGGRALQLLELDEGWFVRDDHQLLAEDALPALPAL